MKSYKSISVLILICLPLLLVAQDQRLNKTKVADILALLPANENQQAQRLFTEMIALDSEGMQLITDGVQPNGKAEGVAHRYAISLLTHYATSKEEKAKVEQSYLHAIEKATEDEVKAYFMKNLEVVGSDKSVSTLATFILNEALADPAISALEAIGTTSALEALTNAVNSASGIARIRLIKALGERRNQPAIGALSKLASENQGEVKKHALWSLARIGDVTSSDLLIREAKSSDFQTDDSESVLALVEFMNQLSAQGDKSAALSVSKVILDNTPDVTQQQVRLAALHVYTESDLMNANKLMLKEYKRFDEAYQRNVLNMVSAYASTPAIFATWNKEYKKASGSLQADILAMLSKGNRSESYVDKTLVSALLSKNQPVRMVAATEIASHRNKKYVPVLLDYLMNSTDRKEVEAGKAAILQVADKEADALIAKKIQNASPAKQAELMELLANRRAVDYFDVPTNLTTANDPVVKDAAYNALPRLAGPKNLNALMSLLTSVEGDKETKLIQAAIVASLDQTNSSAILEAYSDHKLKLLPVLPYTGDQGALEKVVTAFNTGAGKEKETAFHALENWQNHEAVRSLLAIRKDAGLKTYHERAFGALIRQVRNSSWPDDQKLLMLREIMTLATNAREKTAVIRTAGGVRTFLSLMFVSGYLDDPQLSGAASRSAMEIALPTADARPGLTGTEVRQTLLRMLDKLQGDDSQYERIDIETYLANMPYTKGFESIFNGKDLTGWQGLVENPIVRAKMSKEELAGRQKVADAKVKDNWSVRDGMIVFEGDGANLCTKKRYGDFEMLVDWRISKNGDSGIYLRGSPQVQIWDIARVESGAQVGSGGLYNNQKERSTPLTVADNPVGEWNTFHIKMVGERATVHLNGVLVVDNVIMENYWDRSIPIFSEETIELQAHGTELAFRNLYVKELSLKPYELSKEESEQGFEVLFNGRDLNNWIGNKTDYVVEDNTIAIYPAKEGHGNLYTQQQYSDFILRFEFQLTPGANNGLGIHTPAEGDAAYVGKEIQILDNDASIYSTLEPWQYHGSVYGVMPAKRGFLKPTGQWNLQEVHVKGSYIKVTLNGTVILEGDMKKAAAKGALDGKEHPGLNRNVGHLAFLGHGSIVKFRNIRIRNLAK
jgi:hypothetical protein